MFIIFALLLIALAYLLILKMWRRSRRDERTRGPRPVWGEGRDPPPRNVYAIGCAATSLRHRHPHQPCGAGGMPGEPLAP